MVYCPFHEGKLETCSCEVANGSPNVIMIISLLGSCASREGTNTYSPYIWSLNMCYPQQFQNISTSIIEALCMWGCMAPCQV
jgi:hypothetical protein